MKSQKNKKIDKPKCNENWHVFNDGTDKPCQCGVKKKFDIEDILNSKK